MSAFQQAQADFEAEVDEVAADLVRTGKYLGWAALQEARRIVQARRQTASTEETPLRKLLNQGGE